MMIVADVLLWLRKGWIDYIAPQIYWEFTQPNAPFQPILNGGTSIATAGIATLV
jgi:uncharacterized lipoprotein YddW (UPF0748 family)